VGNTGPFSFLMYNKVSGSGYWADVLFHILTVGVCVGVRTVLRRHPNALELRACE
jgi:hypothetical protein